MLYMCYVNLIFALTFPLRNSWICTHVRSMQIYEKLILHLQIEQDFIYPVSRTVRKSLYKSKRYKQITCFAFQIKCYRN